jgi:hypothetical protein
MVNSFISDRKAGIGTGGISYANSHPDDGHVSGSCGQGFSGIGFLQYLQSAFGFTRIRIQPTKYMLIRINNTGFVGFLAGQIVSVTPLLCCPLKMFGFATRELWYLSKQALYQLSHSSASNLLSLHLSKPPFPFFSWLEVDHSPKQIF